MSGREFASSDSDFPGSHPPEIPYGPSDTPQVEVILPDHTVRKKPFPISDVPSFIKDQERISEIRRQIEKKKPHLDCLPAGNDVVISLTTIKEHKPAPVILFPGQQEENVLFFDQPQPRRDLPLSDLRGVSVSERSSSEIR